MTRLAIWWLCRQLKKDKDYRYSWQANIAVAFQDEWKRQSPTLAQIQGAVARGWCAEKNMDKEMDADLAIAISLEVLELMMLNTHQVSNKAADNFLKLLCR